MDKISLSEFTSSDRVNLDHVKAHFPDAYARLLEEFDEYCVKYPDLRDPGISREENNAWYYRDGDRFFVVIDGSPREYAPAPYASHERIWNPLSRAWEKGREIA